MSEPTRYEIEARHPDGRRFLIAFSYGTPSRSKLIRAMRHVGADLIEKLPINESDEVTFGKAGRYPWAETSGWRIRYTGRTQRDARTEGGTAPFIAA